MLCHEFLEPGFDPDCLRPQSFKIRIFGPLHRFPEMDSRSLSLGRLDGRTVLLATLVAGQVVEKATGFSDRRLDLPGASRVLGVRRCTCYNRGFTTRAFT